MNIFILDIDPTVAATMQCDKHVVKMIVESAQMLCSAFDGGVAPYKRTHYNHPCSVWVRKSEANFNWLIEHSLALCDEYTFRYGKKHKSLSVIEWCRQSINLITFPNKDLTPFPQAMPDEFKGNDPVAAYRQFYSHSKRPFAKWTKRSPPEWWQI